MIITFDGASGTGKSTLAKLVANKLNFDFMNSGMVYRAVTYCMLKEGISYSDKNEVERFIKNIVIALEFKDGKQFVFVNGLDCTKHVNDISVAENVSQFAQYLSLMKKIEKVQKDFAKHHNCVFEGRDEGSFVFPNANFKFFIECDIDIRAKRRLADLIKENPNLTIDAVKKQLEARDKIDMTRKYHPLIIPKGAIIIDTSYDTIEQSVEKILKYIKK